MLKTSFLLLFCFVSVYAQDEGGKMKCCIHITEHIHIQNMYPTKKKWLTSKKHFLFTNWTRTLSQLWSYAFGEMRESSCFVINKLLMYWNKHSSPRVIFMKIYLSFYVFLCSTVDFRSYAKVSSFCYKLFRLKLRRHEWKIFEIQAKQSTVRAPLSKFLNISNQILVTIFL